ncbi:acid-sensing ion channel 5 [Brachionus plicatilis]|uniref:Acid-sensing ion channel 5 n=1 Tax=Brachionus plicatilis TaxID=10195 RepID=A0A3M7Q5H9_BRAPC|nr:acid-sensing ion channel 5 [Brachionus plicatilis]
MSNSLLKILSESAEHSSCHGLANISKSRNWFIRTLWILCFSASSSYCIYNLTLSLIDFFNYDVHTKVENHRKPSIEYPAITICHKSLINPQKLKQYSPDLYDTFLESKNFIIKSIDSSSSIAEYLANLEYNFILNFLKYSNEIDNITYGLDDILIDCYFSYHRCTKDHFERLLIPKLGNCFKFNSGILMHRNKNKPGESVYAGTNGGLKLVLNIISEDELNIMKSNGIQMYIHSLSTIPYSSFDLINLPSGFDTNIAIVQEHTTKLPKPYSDCIQETESFDSKPFEKSQSLFGKYQQKFCIFICYYEYIRDLCGCYFVDVYGIEYSEACNITKMHECIEQFDGSFEPKKCLNSCPQECQSIVYYRQISQAYFPSRLIFDILKAKNPDLFLDYEANKSSLLSVNVYHDDISLKIIKDTPAKSIVQLIAEIGGFMGLCVGASMLTVVECADLLFKVILFCKEFKVAKILPK